MTKEDLILQELLDLKKDNKEQHDRIIKRQDIANGRTISLEVWRGYMVGGISAIAFGTGIAITIIFKII